MPTPMQHQAHPLRSTVPQSLPTTQPHVVQMHVMREPPATTQTHNPTYAAEAFQPPTIRQFLADNDLPLEYASMLADLGVVEISHCVDLTLEDLAGFMKPIEARRFIRIAAQWSTGKVEVL
jgi:hypothetical protein